MLNCKGFTLLELLIAAVLVGILTMFATQKFRQTASDIRVENAKRGADTIAAAAFRFRLAYPNRTLPTGSLQNPTGDPASCSTSAGTLQTLVNCGFLDNRPYFDDEDFVLYLNPESEGYSVTVTAKADSNHIKNFSGYTTTGGGFAPTGY